MTLFFTARIFNVKFLESHIPVSFSFITSLYFLLWISCFLLSLRALNILSKDFSDYSVIIYLFIFMSDYSVIFISSGVKFSSFFFFLHLFSSRVSELQCVSSSYLLYFTFPSLSRGFYLCLLRSFGSPSLESNLAAAPQRGSRPRGSVIQGKHLYKPYPQGRAGSNLFSTYFSSPRVKAVY